MFQLADLLLDPAAGTVMRDGQDLRLSRLNFAMLKTLVERAPALVTVDDLLNEVWGDTLVNEETVKQRIKLLRQAIGDNPSDPKYIEVVRGRGYRLVPPVLRPDVRQMEPVTAANRRRSGLYAVYALVFMLMLAVIAWVMLRYDGTELDAGGDQTIADLAPGAEARLAVLPLSDPRIDTDLEWFIGGIHEELITRIAGIPGIQVRSRASVLPFAGESPAPSRVAQLLDVNWILEGSVRRTDNELRVTVSLIDARRDDTAWAESYDHDLSLDSLLAIQSDIALNVAEAIRGQLSTNEITELQAIPTGSLEAYDAQLLGRFHVFRGSEEDIRQALAQFERATRLDPEYRWAWEGLGWAHVMSGTTLGWRMPIPSLQAALKAAQSGLALDAQDSSLLNLRESILLYLSGDTERALQAFSRLADSASHLAGSWINLAFVQALRGEFENSLATAARMQELFPRDPIVLVQAAWFNRAAGRAEQALELARQALEIDAGVSDAHLVAAWAMYDLQEFEAAFLAFEQAGVYSGRILSLGGMGRRAEASMLLQELLALSGRTFIHPVILAMAYLGAGEQDKALDMLERTPDTAGRDVLWMQIDPTLNPLREHPRFKALIARLRRADGSLGAYQ